MRRLAAIALMAVNLQAHGVCWNEAAAPHNLDPLLLKAIAWKESHGRPTAVGPRLKDGNVALGVMQINTIHLPDLARQGITRDHLFDACTNITVGARILADCIARHGQIWAAVGCYYAGPNSRAYAAQAAYVRDVQRYYYGYLAQTEQRPAIPATSEERGRP